MTAVSIWCFVPRDEVAEFHDAGANVEAFEFSIHRGDEAACLCPWQFSIEEFIEVRCVEELAQS